MAVKIVLTLLMVATAILSSSPATTTARAEDPFESYPHIQCEACLVIMEEIGIKMNETSKVKTSVQASFRIEGGKGSERRVDYESSELRAVEILDNICENAFFNTYFLRHNKTTNKRFFSKDKELKRAPFYGKPDKAILGAPSRKLAQYCSLMMDEYDRDITKAIMKERTLDALQQTICHEKVKICSKTKAIEKSLAKEAKYQAAHHKYKEKQRMKKERAEAEKKKLEAAAAEAEAAAAAAAGATTTENGVAESAAEAAKANAAEATPNAAEPAAPVVQAPTEEL